MRRGLTALVPLGVLVAMLSGCAGAPAVETPAREASDARVAAAGDVVVRDAIPLVTTHGHGVQGARPCRDALPSPSWLPDVVVDRVDVCNEHLRPPTSERVLPGTEAARRLGDELVVPRARETTRFTSYVLDGPANRSTLAKDAGGMPTGHPGTEIMLYAYLGGAGYPDPIDGDPYLDVSFVTWRNGVIARVEAPTNGLGAYRVQWVDGGASYLLISPRLRTDEGISGVPLSDALRMAESVR